MPKSQKTQKQMEILGKDRQHQKFQIALLVKLYVSHINSTLDIILVLYIVFTDWVSRIRYILKIKCAKSVFDGIRAPYRYFFCLFPDQMVAKYEVPIYKDLHKTMNVNFYYYPKTCAEFKFWVRKRSKNWGFCWNILGHVARGWNRLDRYLLLNFKLESRQSIHTNLRYVHRHLAWMSEFEFGYKPFERAM